MLVRLAEPDDMEQVYALRLEVFVDEQRVPLELERDELDEVAVHAIACSEGRVVGTGRLVPPGLAGEHATIGRLAVAADARRTGAGAALLAVLEAGARERGWAVVELHAQTSALAFYERYGWTAFGSTYEEAGIEHVSMRKTVQAEPHRATDSGGTGGGTADGAEGG